MKFPFHSKGFPDSSVGQESPAMQETPVDSFVRRIHWRRDRLPAPVFLGFPCGSAGKKNKKQKPTRNEEDLHLIPGSGRSHGEGKGYPLQYSGLENSMDCISRTRLSNFHFHFFLLKIFKYSECHGKSNLV